MKARNCCKTMEMELTAWKAIIYDIARKMDKFSGGEKEKFHPHIEDLHILVEELDQRIDEIRENAHRRRVSMTSKPKGKRLIPI